MSSNTRDSKETKRKSKGFLSSFYFWVLLPILLAVVPVWRLNRSGSPLSHWFPNVLMYTNQRELLKETWKKLSVVDRKVHYESVHIPIIQSGDFSFERLKLATQNFRRPVVVKGMFADAPALTKWLERDYLPSQLKDHQIPLVHGAVVGKLQNNRTILGFEDGWHDVYDNEDSKSLLFFPVRAQFHLETQTAEQVEALETAVNDMTRRDLGLDRIWRGFGDKKTHKNFHGTQLIIGRGSANANTTGTWWHCAPGNNWFVQVAGAKRWYFADQEHSHLLHPIRGGQVPMISSVKREEDHFTHIPTRYVDLQAGDMLYNPDWEWHMIENHDGLSIGVPIREVNITLSLQNNLHFSTIVFVNKFFWNVLGIDIGGYPPLPKHE